jgi:hypothetical protein
MRINNAAQPFHAVEPEIIKPTSDKPAQPSLEAAREKLEQEASMSSLPTPPKPPLDDPLAKAVQLQKLNTGNTGDLPSGPSIRLMNNRVETGSEGLPDTGADVGPGDVTNKEGSDNVGFSFAGRSHTEGDGPIRDIHLPQGGTGTKPTNTPATETSPTVQSTPGVHRRGK